MTPSLLLAGCAGTGTPPDPVGEGPLYLAATWVSDVDATHTYVALVDSLDVEELDFSTALEVPGWGDAWVADGVVFVADGETPNVGRYAVTDDGRLELEAEMGFGSYGVFGASFWDQQILTPTKAFLSDPAGLRYVVWDPTAMEITGTVAWPELTFDEGLAPFHSYTDRGGVVADGLYWHAIYGHDESWQDFGDRSYVLVWDVETDALVDTIEVPCPMMDTTTLGDDGYVYLSGWSYMPLSVEAGASDTNCAVRIDAATRELDAAWTFDYVSATGGDQGSGLRAVSGDDGVFAVFHGSGVPVRPGMDMWELDAGPDDWELYELDLPSRTATPTGVLMGDGSYYESHIDDGYYVYLPNGEDTQVYERTEDGYVPKLRGQGWMSRLFRVR